MEFQRYSKAGIHLPASQPRDPQGPNVALRLHPSPLQGGLQQRCPQYVENRGRNIPRCGGRLVGYCLPYEGTNFVGWGMIGFDSLSAYEQYKSRLRADRGALDRFAMAQNRRFILREERSFVELVEGAFRCFSRVNSNDL